MLEPIVNRDPGDENPEPEEPQLSTGLCAFGWCNDEAAPDSDLCPSCIRELALEVVEDE